MVAAAANGLSPSLLVWAITSDCHAGLFLFSFAVLRSSFSCRSLLFFLLPLHVVLSLTRFRCAPGHANTDDQEIVISFEPTPEAIGFASLVESGRHLETTVRIVLRGGLTDETIEYHVRSAPCEVACDGVRCRCVCVRVCLCVCGPGIDWVLSWK